MRRAAVILRVHRITVARKLKFLATQAKLAQAQFLRRFGRQGFLLTRVQFDEMETFEHTKLKPLSIPMAVSEQRKILAYDVAVMSAKGLLARLSLKKYGPRADRRKASLKKMLKSLQGIVAKNAVFLSDQNPSYPVVLKQVFPSARHDTIRASPGCITGQGELKKTRWDPIFAFNHTAAMFRANVNRLIRRTWCTTKVPENLLNHLAIYVNYHNEVLTA